MAMLPKPGKKNVILITITVFIICLVIAGLVLEHYLSTPAVGSISHNSTPITTSSQQQDNAVSAIQGSNVYFEYPASFKKKTSSKLAANELEKYDFIWQHGTSSAHLAIAVNNLPTGKLADDGSYNYRKKYPDKYKEEALAVGSKTFAVMTDTKGGFAKVAYTVSGNKIATIALTCSDTSNSDNLQQFFSAILSSWGWQ